MGILCYNVSCLKFLAFARTTNISIRSMPVREARLKAAKKIKNSRTGSDTETNGESQGESNEPYVDEGIFRCHSTPQTRKERRRKCQKTLNYRKPPQRKRTLVTDANTVRSTDQNDDDKEVGQGTVQSVILPKQDSSIQSNPEIQLPSVRSLSSATSFQQASYPSLEDTLELSTQDLHPLESHKNSEAYSSLQLIQSHGIECSSGSEGGIVECSSSPSNNLITALEFLMLPSLQMQKTGQLPFLLRNLRRAFVYRCRLLGISTKPNAFSNEPLKIWLIFRLRTNVAVLEGPQGYSDEHQTCMTSWSCPLCDLHGCFETQVMLQKHIKWDHSEVRTKWMHDNEVST